MALALTQTDAPAEEPVTLLETKSFMKIRDSMTEADPDISRLIEAARDQYEQDTRIQLVDATYTLKLNRFPAGPGTIELPRPPLSSVTSIQYVDENGTTQTLSALLYQTDTDRWPGRVVPDADEITWPLTKIGEINAVTITFVAGYGEASDVPERHKREIKMMVLYMFDHPDAATEKRMHVDPIYDMRTTSERVASFG